jgi:hypothetical protein
MSADNLMSDAVMPRAGEVRVMENGMVCRFIESEFEGEKWEVLGALYTGPATPVVGWEDIGTAPKDGANILAWGYLHDDGGPYEADGRSFMGETPHEMIVYFSAEHSIWRDRSHGGSYAGLTHWMRLPPPPSVSTGSRPQEAVPTEQADGSVLVPIGWMQGVWNMGSDALKRLPRDPQGALVSLTGAMMALHAVMPTQPIPQPAEGCSSNEGAGQ